LRTQYEDPNTITTNIMLELRKLGLPTEFSQSKIKQGWGEEVCATLSNLAQMALKAARWKWEAPVFLPEAEEEVAADEGEDEGADAMEVGAGGIGGDDEIEEEEFLEDEDEAFIDTDATKDVGGSGAPKTAGILESSTTHAEWKLELERVLPQLKVHIRADAKDWRNHLDMMRTNRADIEKALEATTVGAREKLLTGGHGH
jgi:estrogen-related receptor beta like 1